MNAPHPVNDTENLLEGFELSPQQARLWQWQNAHFSDTGRRAALRLRITHPLDRERLSQSLEQVIARHEILRTGYQQLAGMAQPMQVIAAVPTWRWATPNDDSQASTPTLATTPLPDGSTSVCLHMPAAHADSASLSYLATEWMRAYHGADLDEPPLQYADYAAWRNELVASDNRARQFWAPYTAAKIPSVPLPLQRHLPAGAHRIDLTEAVCPLPAALQHRWQQHASTLSISPAVTALAAWITLWHQHSEADRLTLGLDWSPRNGPLANAIGLFGEPLPLTIEGLDTLTFNVLCQRLNQQCAELGEWRDAHPSAALTAPFAVGFRHLPPYELAAFTAAGWQIEHADSPTAPFQLLLEYHATPVAAPLVLHYNQALYDVTAIDLIIDQFTTLLDNACRHPERPLRALSACSVREQDLLNTTLSTSLPLTAAQQQRYEQIASLPHLVACFSEQIQQSAAQPAVTGPTGTLTYAELDAQSTALAQRLLARGIQPQTRIALFLPRDTDAIVALLAIFKAGACYVPVDPHYPTSRIEYILNDSQAELVITRSDLAAQLPAAWQHRTVATDQPETVEPVTPLPWPTIEATHCAYIIYTSGSTGQPKGVTITHANALSSLAARIAYYPEPVRRFLLLSSFAFDSSIAGLFWSLAQGGCLHLCSESQQKDPAQLAHILRTAPITHLLALPSLYALLLDELGDAAHALNTIIVAGEACPRSLVETHYRRWPAVRLYNEYGPTEASVWSCVAACQPATGEQPVPIGRAIPHARIYLLNEGGEPVARGMKGEIYIGGPGLSPGYLHRPELTAEKFVVAAQQRLYRTGDFAYFGQEDQLVFIGRADAQVKIRGYRIELGEIETVLRRLTDANQTVALADTSQQGNTTLRAFIESAHPIDTAALREQLAQRLPEYMVPSDIQVLPTLPRTANGKFDTAALLALQPAQQRLPYAAPRNHTEKVLIALWQEMLSTDQIGIHDNFFALGGHSLLVVRLVHRIKATLYTDIPVSLVFQYPTVAQLAAQIAQPAAHASLVMLRPGERSRPPLFCLHRPAGDVHHYLPMVAALSSEQPVYGVPLPPGRSPDNASLAELATLYLADIRTVQPEGPYFVCGWSMGGLLALELAHQLEQAGERIALLAMFDTTFHAEDGSLDVAQLDQLVKQELTSDSLQRLATLSTARDDLHAATASLGKIDQLHYALIDWPAQHGLTLRAPLELIETNLRAMRNARRWVQPYAPPKVKTDLHLWWVEDTLLARGALPTQWEQFSDGDIHHHRVPGDHDDILAQPQFFTTFNATLAQALTTTEFADEPH